MSLDDVNCFPSNLTTAATPPRSGVPSANNCCCMVISPLKKPTTFTPNPIPPASTAHPPRSNCICRAPWCKDFQISLLDMWPGHLLAHFPRRPHQTTGHRKNSTFTMDKGAGTQQEPRPWVLCMGSPGPTDQSWLESQLPTSASSPASAPAGELWQPLPRERQSCCALTSERG